MTDLEKIMNLVSCTREDAIEALKDSNGDLVNALTLLIDVPTTRGAPKPKVLDAEQEFFRETRKQMELLVDGVQKGFTSSDQSVPSEYSDSLDHPVGMVQQNNYSLGYHPPSPELKVEIPEIVCRSQSECSSGLLLNDQKLPCSDQECRQSCPCLEKAS